MEHIKKESTVKEPELIKYLAAVRRMEKLFVRFTFRHILRSKNAEADELAKAATQKAPMLADVFLSRAISQSHMRRRGTTLQHARYRKQGLEITHIRLPQRNL